MNANNDTYGGFKIDDLREAFKDARIRKYDTWESVTDGGRRPDWRGRLRVRVSAEEEYLFIAAFDFHGALVDSVRTLKNGDVSIYSRGYRAHGF